MQNTCKSEIANNNNFNSFSVEFLIRNTTWKIKRFLVPSWDFAFQKHDTELKSQQLDLNDDKSLLIDLPPF